MNEITRSDIIERSTMGFGDTLDIADTVGRILKNSGVRNGLVASFAGDQQTQSLPYSLSPG
jgi:hypothetical protein